MRRKGALGTAGSILVAATILSMSGAFAAERAERHILALTYPEGETVSVKFQGTPRLPRSSGEAKVERKKGMTEIEIELDEMKPATLFGGDYNTYVLWVVSPEGQVDNVGEFIIEGNRSKLDVSTPLETFGMFVTAEPHFLVGLPSEFVVMENTEPTRDMPIRVGRIDYSGFPGDYVFEHESLEAFDETKGERRTHLESARTAVSLAERAEAADYAPTELKLAREALERAELAAQKGVEGKNLMILAHESIRRAVEAQQLSERRSYEAALAAEREAHETELRELQASLGATKNEAEHARLLAEKRQMEAGMEARAREAAERQAREAFERAQEAEEEARRATEARLEAEREKSAAERRAFEAKQEEDEAREQLRTVLSEFMKVQDSARGLIVSLPDVLFEFDEATLTPEGRETLAKLAGVVLLTDGYQLRVEGHTDSIGSEDYNRELSRARAESVRSYLLGQGVPPARLDEVVGYGESRPVASNDTSEGRQQNRRVEIVFEEAAPLVSGIPERR